MQRITYPAACVLQALARGSSYGFDIVDVTGLPSGTVYPLLRRFERAGLLTSRWEAPDEAFQQGRPRRRHYQLSDRGREALAVATERYRLHRALFDDGAPARTSPSD